MDDKKVIIGILIILGLFLIVKPDFFSLFVIGDIPNFNGAKLVNQDKEASNIKVTDSIGVQFTTLDARSIAIMEIYVNDKPYSIHSTDENFHKDFGEITGCRHLTELTDFIDLNINPEAKPDNIGYINIQAFSKASLKERGHSTGLLNVTIRRIDFRGEAIRCPQGVVKRVTDWKEFNTQIEVTCDLDSDCRDGEFCGPLNLCVEDTSGYFLLDNVCVLTTDVNLVEFKNLGECIASKPGVNETIPPDQDENETDFKITCEEGWHLNNDETQCLPCSETFSIFSLAGCEEPPTDDDEGFVEDCSTTGLTKYCETGKVCKDFECVAKETIPDDAIQVFSIGEKGPSRGLLFGLATLFVILIYFIVKKK